MSLQVGAVEGTEGTALDRHTRWVPRLVGSTLGQTFLSRQTVKNWACAISGSSACSVVYSRAGTEYLEMGSFVNESLLELCLSDVECQGSWPRKETQICRI